MKKTILAFLLTFSLTFCLSQDTTTHLANTQVSFFDSSDAILPVLIKAALKNAPQMAILKTGKQSAENNLRLSKKEFLKDFNLQGGYNYGNINTVFPHTDGQSVPLFYDGSRIRSTYTAGVGVGINLEQLFGGKKLRVEKQKLAIQQSESEIKEGEKEIRKQVITLYQQVKLSRAVLQHTQDALQTAYVNKTMAEKQFKEGNMQVSEQMTTDQLYTSALLAAEQAKNAYQTNLMLLEEMVGMPVLPLLSTYYNK
ncbi:MAG TPA: TolC family protein [Chitinophagaceae bacterium]|nr:TolC family protein [Chitinophagaceae bacterium]